LHKGRVIILDNLQQGLRHTQPVARRTAALGFISIPIGLETATAEGLISAISY